MMIKRFSAPEPDTSETFFSSTSLRDYSFLSLSFFFSFLPPHFLLLPLWTRDSLRYHWFGTMRSVPWESGSQLESVAAGWSRSVSLNRDMAAKRFNTPSAAYHSPSPVAMAALGTSLSTPPRFPTFWLIFFFCLLPISYWHTHTREREVANRDWSGVGGVAYTRPPVAPRRWTDFSQEALLFSIPFLNIDCCPKSNTQATWSAILRNQECSDIK